MCFYKGYSGQNKGFKGNFSKNKERSIVHPCNSIGGKCPLMSFIMGGQMSVHRDIMPAQVICKFHKDPIKMKGLCPEQCLLWPFSTTKANNSKVTGLIWLAFELV